MFLCVQALSISVLNKKNLMYKQQDKAAQLTQVTIYSHINVSMTENIDVKCYEGK